MKILTKHLDSVGENYFEHMGHAFSFGGEMLIAGVACLLHGFFPFLFEKTGSAAINRLHVRMVEKRVKHAPTHVPAE